MKIIGKIFLSVALSTTLSLQTSAETLKMAYDADPVTMDIHEQLSGGMLQLSHMVFDPLVRWTQDLRIEPRLATKWEQINTTTLRFHLRKGVKFHSGNTMTADDVIFTFNRLRASKDFAGIFAPFKEIRKVNDHVVDLVSDKPFPLALSTATYIFPLDKKFYSGTDVAGNDKAAIVKHGNSFASTNASGTGPYIVTQREQGVKVTFKRFTDYWETNSPGNVDTVILTPIANNQTRVAALLSGDIDFIAPVAPNDFQQVKKNKETDLITLSGTRIITFQLNQNRVEAFKDKRVRLAMIYAVNNRGIVRKIMKGFGTAAAQFSPAGYDGYNPALKPRYNLNKARELMQQAGYGDGFSITMMAPNNRYVNDAKIAQAVAQMWSKIGIKVDLKTMPKAQYWPKFDERAADALMIGWHSDTEDSANFYEFLAMTPNDSTGMGVYNSGNYSNPKVDQLTQAVTSMVDREKRAKVLQEIEQIIHDDGGFVPLHWQDLAWGARKGVRIKPIVNALNFPYIGDLVIKR